MEHPDQVTQAVRLRTAGHSNRSIGKQLGISHQTVSRWLAAADRAADAAAVAPVIDAVRDYRAEVHRVLDQVIDANLAEAGTPGNGNLLIRAVEVRSRLEGLIAAPVPQPVAGQPVWSGRVLLMPPTVIDAVPGSFAPARQEITE
jgi:hypothetical protein